MAININEIDDVQTYEQPAEEPPRFFWLKGLQSARTVGRFYIKASELDQPPSGLSWTESSHFDNEAGFEAQQLRIAPIGRRAQPYREEVDGDQRRRIWLERYEDGARIYTELICFVEGIEGPCIWSFTGMVGRAVTGKGGILKQAGQMLRDLQKQYHRTFNCWALWLPISPAIDQAGKPLYTKTGFNSAFNMPSLSAAAAALDDLWIGADAYRAGADVYERFKSSGWFEARRGNVAPPAPAEEAPPYAGMPEVPIPDDMEF